MRSQEVRLKSDLARARLACALAAYSLGDDADALEESQRSHRVSMVRQVAMYLLHVVYGMSLARIANAFGRDRSTAAYACHRIEDARDDPDFDTRLEALEDALRTAPAPVGIAA